MNHDIKGPFSLSEPEPSQHGGDVVDLHASNHGGVATICWRMEDDERSPGLEAFAHHVVKCLNMHADLVQAIEQAKEREYNPFEPDNQTRFYIKLSALLAKAKKEVGNAET